MSSSIEDRIVAMKMENTQFEKAVNQSLQSWTKLEQTLNKGISAKGFDAVQNGVGRFNLNPITGALSEVGKAWLAMSTIAVTALATITSSVVQTGLQTAKSLTIEPLMQGFNEYSTNLQSIQTVLANTQAAGTTLDDVNGALQQLNNYSDKTIYNFGEMAKNIGTFTAAGVGLQDSVDSIKGIANLAALSGSSSEQASTAMYQLSQAIASGRVSLQDWNSVVNAGMGGTTFQRALANTAIAMGTLSENAVSLEGPMKNVSINGSSFRDSISAIGGEKWLTSDVLTNTLSQFTGDLSDAQLAAQGFNKEQIKSIQQTAKTAEQAATQVKTISQVFDVAKETIGSGWSLTFQRIFGDFGQAKSTMTELSNFINGIVKRNSNARNRVLKDWGEMGGRTKIISAITNAWKALMSVLGPIHDAFREIFPAKTAEQLFQLSKGLNQLMRHLRLTKEAQENLKRTFAGFFAVIHIGLSIVEGLAHVLFTVLGLFVRGQGTTLAFTGGIGDMLVALDKFLTGGDRMKKFFDGLAQAITFILKPLLEIRSALIGGFASLLTGDPSAFFDAISQSVTILLGLVDKLSDGFANVVNTISDAMGGLGHISGFNLAGMFGGLSGAGGAGGAKKAIDGIKDSLEGISAPSLKIKEIWDKIAGIFSKVGDFLAPLKADFERIKNAFQNLFNNLGSGISFDQFLATVQTGLFFALYLQFRNFSKALGGVAEAASGVLDQVTSNLKTMQADVRADVILKIAASLALLAAAVYVLAQTDPQSLAVALGAMTAMLAELVGALMLLEKKVAGFGSGAKLVAIGAAFTLMAVGMAAMAGAVFLFGQMDMKTIGKGLLGAGIALAFLTASAAAMSKSGAGANMVGAAAGLLIMSAALIALAGAVELYARLDLGTLMNGLLKVGAALVVLAAGTKLMTGSITGAVAMLIVANALIVLSGALALMGAMSGGTLAKGLLTMTVALAAIAGAMYLMTSALPGAAALYVVAAALVVLGPAIAFFGQMDWGTIIKGLVVVAGALLVLAGVAALIAPVVPVLLGLAAAVALIGAAVFLTGTGIAAFATGLALLAINGAAGFKALENIIMEFLDFLPKVVLGFGDTIDAIAQLIGDHVPALQAAFTALILGMINAAIKLTPRFGKLIQVMIQTGLRVLVSYYSDLANAGLDLIEHLLKAIADHVGDIAHQASQIAINFVRALAKESVRFANAAIQALIDFLNGLADAIRSHQGELNAAGGNIADAIVKGIISFIGSAAGSVLGALNSMLQSAVSKVHVPHLSLGGLIGKRGQTDVFGDMARKLGLIGGVDDVKDALSTMSGAIKQGIQDAESQIEKLNAKKKQLKKDGKLDTKEGKKVLDQLEDQKKLLKDLQAEQDNWNKKQKAHRAALLEDAKAWDNNAKQIADWTQKVKDAEDARDNFQAGIVSQFGAKPDISAGMSLQSYLRQIAKKTQETQKFMETLQALRAQGLSDESYRQLLAEGTDAQHLMEQLLQGGGDAIATFNQANSALMGAANTLASTASVSLFYDAAVDQAQGMLKGWQDSQAALEEQMTIVARAMVKAIKKALKMKSPSRVFMEVGDFSSQGVAKGLEAGIGGVEKSSEKVGYAALDTLTAVMNKGVSMGAVDVNPTITPVLDLTQLQKDATKIGTMLASEPLVATVSYEKASSVSSDHQAALDAALQAFLNAQDAGDTNVEYTQILQSPKAISPVDTYRATKSAIPLMKEALKV